MPNNGTRIQHCPVCHIDLGGTSIGDAHRVGPFPDGRRCLSVEEMDEKGWHQDERGVWHGASRDGEAHWTRQV
jgi:hypothetical protein